METPDANRCGIFKIHVVTNTTNIVKFFCVFLPFSYNFHIQVAILRSKMVSLSFKLNLLASVLGLLFS